MSDTSERPRRSLSGNLRRVALEWARDTDGIGVVTRWAKDIVTTYLGRRPEADGAAAADSEESHTFADDYEGTYPLVELLGRYTTEQKPALVLAVVSTVVWRLANLVPPYLLGVAMDGFFTTGSDGLSLVFFPDAWMPVTTRGQFGVLAAIFGGLVVVQVAAYGLRFVSWRHVQQSVIHDLRMEAYEATQGLRMGVFDDEQTGDVMSVLNNDVNQLREFLDEGMQSVLHTAAFYVGLLAAMAALHWQLTLVVSVFVPVMLAVIRLYHRHIGPRYQERRSEVGRLNSHIQGVIDGIATVKAFTNESREKKRLRERSESFWWADWKAAVVSGVFFPARQAISLGVAFAIVGLGGYWALFGPPWVFTQPLSPGTFVTFFFFGQMFVGQTARLGDIVDTYADAESSAERVFGLMAVSPGQDASGDSRTLTNPDGAISFEEVTFSYDDDTSPVLNDVGFEIDPGEYVGIVGPTGAGKSTILKLLLRFYRPQEGRICVDDTGLQDISVTSLRKSIGYVGQDTFLFDATVGENIMYGSEGRLSDEDWWRSDSDHSVPEPVKDAAQKANAHGFITALPDGYATQVGEDGTKLSGGQRQRIAIARAILKDPEILLLDEATSHVDNRTEMLMQQSLNRLISGRTTIAIAHRLSTVRDADELLVLDDGQIAERGPHEELVERGEIYADLWDLHVGNRDAVDVIDQAESSQSVADSD